MWLGPAGPCGPLLAPHQDITHLTQYATTIYDIYHTKYPVNILKDNAYFVESSLGNMLCISVIS